MIRSISGGPDWSPDSKSKKLFWMTRTSGRTIQRTVKDGDEKRIVTKQQKVRPWWRTDTAGHLFMSIPMGGGVVEFEKGKAAVAVHPKEKLPVVITALIEAVRAGELDDILAQAKRPGFGKVKKAA